MSVILEVEMDGQPQGIASHDTFLDGLNALRKAFAAQGHVIRKEVINVYSFGATFVFEDGHWAEVFRVKF